MLSQASQTQIDKYHIFSHLKHPVFIFVNMEVEERLFRMRKGMNRSREREREMGRRGEYN